MKYKRLDRYLELLRISSSCRAAEGQFLRVTENTVIIISILWEIIPDRREEYLSKGVQLVYVPSGDIIGVRTTEISHAEIFSISSYEMRNILNYVISRYINQSLEINIYSAITDSLNTYMIRNSINIFLHDKLQGILEKFGCNVEFVHVKDRNKKAIVCELMDFTSSFIFVKIGVDDKPREIETLEFLLNYTLIGEI